MKEVYDYNLEELYEYRNKTRKFTSFCTGLFTLLYLISATFFFVKIELHYLIISTMMTILIFDLTLTLINIKQIIDLHIRYTKMRELEK